jgi:hypothetical protein
MMSEIDPHNGRLLDYLMFDESEAGGVDIRIQPAKAILLAKIAIGSTKSNKAHVVVGKPELGWAVPDIGFGSRYTFPKAPPFKAKLAYQVTFNNFVGGTFLNKSFVRIDAKTGEVLGGDETL